MLRWLDPLMRPVRRSVRIGNIVELRVRGRTTGLERVVPVGVLRVADRMYLGHPNGPSAWTRNLEAAGQAILVTCGMPPVTIRPVRLGPSAERDAVILATSQHVFPGNLVYRLARRHIRAVGAYYRLEPVTS
jgi:hypothetical protein